MQQIEPIWLALIGGLFTWGITALGASMVFFLKEIPPKVLNFMMGFAAGIMIAASFWSLLLPALELCENKLLAVVPIVGGFGIGALFLYIADKIIAIIIKKQEYKLKINTVKWNNRNSIKKIRRSLLLILAITIHNIPEGLSFGVAYGNATKGATALMLGIGLQNFPEGAAVAIPLQKEGYSRKKSFLYGQASAIVEPVAAVFGAWLANTMHNLLPYALSFAAGAMIYVVVEELIPSSQTDSHLYGHCATCGAIIGFMIMTFMDIAIG